MAEVTALGFEYTNRTDNTLDGLTATARNWRRHYRRTMNFKVC
jgi:hypothetical protein